MTEHEWVDVLFPGVGYFVEAGAHDGIGDSQTYRLEQRGWRGLCVEPSWHFRGLRQNRRCAVDRRALWAYCGSVIFREIHGDQVELSGIPWAFGDHWPRRELPGEERMVACATLTRVLQDHAAPPVIEFLCLDVEGAEEEVLKAHDFGKFLFLAMLVEHNGNLERLARIDALVQRHGYHDAGRDGVNARYEHDRVRTAYLPT